MKFITSLLVLFFFASTYSAASECRDADGKIIEQAGCANGADDSADKGSGFPEEALAQVKELEVEMRYFKAIGFHAQSKQKRDEIEAIYKEHGLPLPDEYQI
jgi:hypothetical protein